MKGKKYLGVIFVLLFCIFHTNMVQAGNYLYEVEVNLSQNIVTVYGQDQDGRYTVPEKAFVCSSGKGTPTGTFQTSDKYKWREMFGGVYAQYATRITGHILFHSVPYLKNHEKSTLDYQAYNELGKTVSMGCIRLTVEDTKWIYDNCPEGTTVRIVQEGKIPIIPKAPQKIDIKDMEKRGWDPTDTDEKNPWNTIQIDVKQNKKPTAVQGEKEIIGIESDTCVGTVEALRVEGSYYMRSQDISVIWGDVGKKIKFPKTLPEAKKQDDMVLVSYEENQLLADYSICDDIPYYKIRDLARLTQYDITWIQKLNRMLIFAPHTKSVNDIERENLERGIL